MTSVTARSSTSGATAKTADGSKRLPPWRNPWRHSWFLEGFTWLYLLWSLAPIAIAVLSMLLLLVLLVPMIYYVVATNRSSREAM